MIIPAAQQRVEHRSGERLGTSTKLLEEEQMHGEAKVFARIALRPGACAPLHQHIGRLGHQTTQDFGNAVRHLLLGFGAATGHQLQVHMDEAALFGLGADIDMVHVQAGNAGLDIGFIENGGVGADHGVDVAHQCALVQAGQVVGVFNMQMRHGVLSLGVGGKSRFYSIWVGTLWRSSTCLLLSSTKTSCGWCSATSLS